MVNRPPDPGEAAARRRSLWWWESALAVVGYWLYAAVRDAHGRSGGTTAQDVAFQHGRQVRHVERLVGLNVEHKVQHAFLHLPWLLRILGGFYGSAHFVVTFAVLTYLLIRHSRDYARWRTRLVITTFLSVGLFALYPTAPPRLLPDGGVQDTLATVGGLWSYNNGVLERISDPFAAMPSLHLGWSCWVAASLAGTLGASWTRRRRWLLWLYPGAVTVTVLATGTHWLLDAFAGAALFALVCAGDRELRALRPRAGAALHAAPVAMASALVETRDAFAD